MFLVYEERRMFVRPGTHTVVFEHEPDFATFLDDPSGRVDRFVRVWIAERGDTGVTLLAYLGALHMRGFAFGRRSLRAVLDRLRREGRRLGGVALAERLATRMARHLRRFAEQGKERAAASARS